VLPNQFRSGIKGITVGATSADRWLISSLIHPDRRGGSQESQSHSRWCWCLPCGIMAVPQDSRL
jgi:hypothetical protein